MSLTIRMAGTMAFVHWVQTWGLDTCNDLFTSGVNQTQTSLSTECQPPHRSRFLFPFLNVCFRENLECDNKVKHAPPSFPPTHTTSSCCLETVSVLLTKWGYWPRHIWSQPSPPLPRWTRTALMGVGGRGRGTNCPTPIRTYTRAMAGRNETAILKIVNELGTNNFWGHRERNAGNRELKSLHGRKSR